MSKMFAELIQGSRRINRNQFAANFGGIAEDVVEMLNSEQAREVTRKAREIMETAKDLPNGMPRLRSMDFGLFSAAPELEQGLVAAVDGTTPLPLQLYSAGQALCVGIGSLSHRRPMQESMHYWSSKVFLAGAKDEDDFLAREEQGIFGISQTAYLRYFEIKHGLEIKEDHVLFDGTLVYEWLVASQEGVKLYLDLFLSAKKAMGVIKSIKANALFAAFARALKSGEIYIIETLADHLEQSNVPNKNVGERSGRYVLPEFHNEIAPKILRGIFKPRKKAFGFEVHSDHLEDMLRIMIADCQMNNPGHEIPYLLNRIDEEVRKNFNQRILRDRIALCMVTQSEELFFEETNERLFR
ncbi:MAG: hypothetical protein L0220_00545 [Acidobacteria bacterium]|nr:hypothetical protein [Acidobacteriota bacterium]